MIIFNKKLARFISLLSLVAVSICGCCFMGNRDSADLFEDLPEKYEPPEWTMAEIWEIEDQTDFRIALNGYILDKCQYGDDIDKLSAPERVIFVVFLLEGEVNNGGFSQFFFNSSGDYSNELVNAFTEICAVKTAEICKRAVSIYGESVPIDRAERDQFLLDHEEVSEILDECDTAFYQYEDDLDALIYDYALRNKESFT